MRKIYKKLKVTHWGDKEKVAYLRRLGRWGSPELPPHRILGPLHGVHQNYFEYIASEDCTFGWLMAYFRNECTPHLTQKQLAYKMSEWSGIHITVRKISDCECKQTAPIHKEDRKTLVALIAVLHECGGINCLSDANRLLHLGNYRSLNVKEIQQINENWYWQLPGVI